MLKINLDKIYEKIEISKLEDGEFFLWDDKLCQKLSDGNKLKLGTEFSIPFIEVKNGTVDAMRAHVKIIPVDVEINVSYKK